MALAKRLLFTGNLLPAPELAEYGLVNQVVPDEQLTGPSRPCWPRSPNSPLGVRLIAADQRRLSSPGHGAAARSGGLKAMA